MIFWYNFMAWESRRLMRKANKCAERLAKACDRQSRHNNNLASFEAIVNKLLEQ